MADHVITVSGLRMRYGTKDVLLGVDFDVARGRSGVPARAERRRQDHDDRDPRGLPDAAPPARSGCSARTRHGDEDWRARIGVVLQSWRDHPRWTPRAPARHLGGYYAPYSTPERPRPYDVDMLLETVGLADLADQKIVTLSGGQRRRLDVAVGHRRPAGAAVPGRADRRLRPAGPPRVPRPGAPAVRPGATPRSC